MVVDYGEFGEHTVGAWSTCDVLSWLTGFHECIDRHVSTLHSWEIHEMASKAREWGRLYKLEARSCRRILLVVLEYIWTCLSDEFIVSSSYLHTFYCQIWVDISALELKLDFSWFGDFMLWWFRGVMVWWFHDSMLFWFHDSMIPWFCAFVVSWFRHLLESDVLKWHFCVDFYTSHHVLSTCLWIWIVVNERHWVLNFYIWLHCVILVWF